MREALFDSSVWYSVEKSMRVGILCASWVAVMVGCGSGESGGVTPAPAPATALQQPSDPNQPPPGHVFITVAASSLPPGATVTGGGQMLGMTPLTVRVPVPMAAPGETQTFQFTFQLPGFQPATISASPINSTITLNAALAPVTAVSEEPAETNEGDASDDTNQSFTVRGASGGAIYDNHTTTSTIRVGRSCVMGSLRVDINGNHTFNADLGVSLRGPDGTVYPLQNRESRTPFRAHTVRRAAGRSSQGTWTLSIADMARADSGNLRGWSMTVRCR